MALQFECDSCGHLITVKHLTIGEEAKCFHCGMITIVPEYSAHTNGEPDYDRFERQDDVYKTPRRNIFEPSGKQILFSLLTAALFGVLGQLLLEGADSILKIVSYFLVTFIIAYFSSFLPAVFTKYEKEIHNFANSAAPRNGKCISCKKDIIKGEPIFLKSDFISRIFHEEMMLCIQCYNDHKLLLMKSKSKSKPKFN